jgi:hypothetical protein
MENSREERMRMFYADGYKPPRTMNERMQDALKSRNEMIKRLGIHFQKELNDVIIDLNEMVRNVDFLSIINDDEDRKDNVVKNMIRPYEVEMLRIVGKIEDDLSCFNDDMFQTLRAGLILHFEEIEDYEKCDKLIKLCFDDVVDFYVPPYVVKNNSFFNRRRKRRR